MAALEEVAAELTASGDDVGVAKAHHVAAQGHVQLGRLGAAESALDQALTAARRADDRRRVVAVLAVAPRAALWGPSPVVRASGRCLDVLRILRMNPGQRHVEPVALRCQAVLEAMRGRFDPAREILAAARATLQELGLSYELHELATHAGIVELLAGDLIAAEMQLNESRDGFTTLGVGVGAARAAALLARVLVEQGRDDQAVEQTRFAEAHAGGDLKTTITWCGARAEALARKGDSDEALALVRRAVALAEPTDALPDKADATLTLARVLREVGRDAEVVPAAEAALALYRAKDHLVGAGRASELLGVPAPVADRPAAPEPLLGDGPAEGSDVLGDRPPGRVLAELWRRWAAMDLDVLLDMFTDDVVRIDHRALSWEEVHGRDALREVYASILGLPLDLRVETDEVLACDDRVVAVRATVHGTGTGAGAGTAGGEYALPSGYVFVIQGGRVARFEQFGHDDNAGMLARYAALGGTSEVLGDRPPERIAALVWQQWAARDLDALVDMFTEDVVRIDHHKIGWEEVHGRAALRELYRSGLGLSPNLRVVADEVLACDDRVLAVRATLRGTGFESDGGGEYALPSGYVFLIDGERVTRLEQFEHDERAAMLARYAELGGGRSVLGDRPPERLVAEFARLYSAREFEAVSRIFADDWVLVDHRELGWEDMHGPDGARTAFTSTAALASDVGFAVDEVLACDDRVLAMRAVYSGTFLDGGGRFEVAAGIVTLAEGGLLRRTEHFDYDDQQAVIACYAALGGGQGLLGDRPPERVLAEYIRRWAAHDVEAPDAYVDRLVDMFADDYVAVDHRRLGWDPEIGRAGARNRIESALALVTDSRTHARIEVDEVLACDDRLFAARVAIRGTQVDGGGMFELAYGLVITVEDNLIRRFDRYEYDDTSAILARYAELGGEVRR